MNDTLPALEGRTSSEIVAQHLNASHSARKAFIGAETSDKIRRALKHQIRPSRKPFNEGDLVYYKREENTE